MGLIFFVLWCSTAKLLKGHYKETYFFVKQNKKVSVQKLSTAPKKQKKTCAML